MGERAWSSTAALLVVSLLGITTGPVGAASELLPSVTERLESERAALIELRHDIHRHPEVSGQEERTAGLVAERLRAVGFEVRTGVGGHGVIGVLRGGRPGPVVAFRADMDAVRSDAPDPVEYRSITPGVRHICGHDLHTTVGVALAEGLSSVRDRLAGTVVLVFQPAEENVEGASAMLADGALEDPEPAAIFAFHTAPFEVGSLATAPGGLMASIDRVRVTIERSPDPEATANALSDRIRALSTVAPEQAALPTAPDFTFVRVSPRPPSAGGRWSVEGSVTTARQEVRSRAHAAVAAAVAELGRGDTALRLDYDERHVPGVDNDPALVKRASAAAESALGAGAVIPVDVVPPGFSEDFGAFQERVPGVMFYLGVSNQEKGIVGMPHSPGYAADDEAIFVGARAMAAVLLDFLESGVSPRRPAA